MSAASQQIWDLSPSVTPQLPVWPGDTAYSRTHNSLLANGDSVDLSEIRTTLHLGSHADAPRHTEPGGEARGIDAMPLDAYLGPATVIEANLRDAQGRVDERVLEAVELDGVARVLLRTGVDRLPSSQAKPAAFPEDFAGLSPNLARRLRDQGVRLIGTDAPSIDPFSSKELEVHHLLLGHGVAVLEGLVLADVPVGTYELIALPLRLSGADASPVRAVLRALS